ncbi:MAG: acyltransferase family protein [Azonexus sp.]
MNEGVGVREGFRTDINGLRAWAVVVVILYHFNIPWFDGGFVGVDVFFVISGYLMTRIIVNGMEVGRFSVADFYLARARRIVPALLGVCATLLLVGWFYLLPTDYDKLSRHVISSLGFYSNFSYWKEAGYFNSSSHENWLLHTWSLSAEWQFYLILPIFLKILWAMRPNRLFLARIMLAGFAFSLALSIIASSIYPTPAFFLLHTRSWEMLAGGLAFLVGLTPRLTSAKRKWIEILGLFLILIAVFSVNKNSSWPGWQAIVPVLGATMVLLACRASPWTGNKLAQWLGDRSYSLYLWHWPLVVLLVYLDLSSVLWAVLTGLGLTILLGHFSFRLLEVPTRKGLARFRPGMVLTILGVSTLAIAIPSVTIKEKNGVWARTSSEVQSILNESNNRNPRQAECLAMQGIESRSCIFGGNNLKAVLLGDSHADAVVTALEKALPSEIDGVMNWSYVSCPVVFGVKNLSSKYRADEKCGDFLMWAANRLKSIPNDVPLIVVNRAAVYAIGHNEKWEDDSGVPLIYFTATYSHADPKFINEFSERLSKTACELAKSRTVYLLRPIPEIGLDVPKTMARALNVGVRKNLSISLADYHARNDFVWAAQNVARDKCGVKILDPLPFLCDNDHCYASREGRPLYYDDDHLSEFGNKLLIPMFSNIFNTKDNR